MLTLISESAAQVNLPLVTIDPGTIVFTLINTLIIFILFKVFLFKPVGKILDKRNEMAAAEKLIETGHAHKTLLSSVAALSSRCCDDLTLRAGKSLVKEIREGF